MKKMTICFLLFVVMTAYLFGIETNWPNWRGPHHNRSVESGEYPVQWDIESDNVIWKIDIPGKGFSTPIVWDLSLIHISEPTRPY